MLDRSAATLGAFLATSLLAPGAQAAAPETPLAASAAPPPVTVDLGVRLGPSFRVGAAPSFTLADRAGFSLGAAAYITPAPRFSLGLSYEHTGLGRETGGTAPDYVDLTRDLDALWAGLRLHLLNAERARLSLQLGLGLAFQSAEVTAVLSQGFGDPPIAIQCSGSASANVGFRAGLGAEILLGGGVSFLADALADNVRLSSDVLDECVPGAGTVTLLSVKAGFGYRFDVSRFVR